ncbi:MAG: hypothetical protein GY754_42130 [bacterium]|nr:hypothetical protein [bacterium]
MKTNLKIDYKKEYKEFYNPSKKQPEIVEVPELSFLMIDGKNAEPENEVFQMAIQALFAVSFKAKFISKKELAQDYAVMPLEGLWWADNMNDFKNNNKKKWKWTLMIMQPEYITGEMIEAAKAEVQKKKGLDNLADLRLETYTEGRSGQIMHIGPYSEEHENILKIHNTILETGGSFDGQVQKHHEIYLSDFRKTAPEKLKTVIRQPFI